MPSKKIFFALLLSFLSLSAFAQRQQLYSRAKIYLDEAHSLDALSALGLPVDHGESKKGVYFTSDFSGADIRAARKAGFTVEIIIKDVAKHYRQQNSRPAQRTTAATCDGPAPAPPAHFHLGSYAGFFTYTEMLQILDSMRLLYPGLISAKQPIDTFHSIEGRPIYWVRVSNNPDVEQPLRPQMLYTSVHHAREPGSLSANIYYLWYLLENYASNPQVKTILDNTELYFIPCVNPDGYIYNITTDPAGGGMWRKNRRDNLDGTFGVDINRNYGYKWAYDGIGSSASPATDVYRGASAFSEPETRAVKWFCDTHNFRMALNYHTFGKDFVYPWSYIRSLQSVDSATFFTYGRHMARNSRYRYGTPDQTVGYVTNGDSNDWMYGDTSTKHKVLAMTPEIGTPANGFYPPASQIIPDCHDNLYHSLAMASFLLPFAAITPMDRRILTTPSGHLHYNLQRLGIADTATYTVNILPLDSWLTVPSTPKTYTGLALLQTVSDSFTYTLSAGTPNGQLISYVLQAYNGQYYIRDTVRFYYGKFYALHQPSTESLSDWVETGWSTSPTVYFTPPASIHSAPAGVLNYANGLDITLTTAAPIDLTHATRAYLHFYAKWAIENNADYALVNASVNGSGSFTPLCGRYTKEQPFEGIPVYDGHQPEWVFEEMDLSDYLGQKIDIQFELTSDLFDNYEGIYLDDISIVTVQDSPQAVRPVSAPAASIMVWPNPAGDQLHITVPGYTPGSILTASLHDCLGRTVHTCTISNKQTITTISHLPSGTYYLKVYDNNTSLPVQKVNIVH